MKQLYNTLNLNDFNTLNDTCELPPTSNSPTEIWDKPAQVARDGIDGIDGIESSMNNRTKN